jgi:hypothetical protein
MMLINNLKDSKIFQIIVCIVLAIILLRYHFLELKSPLFEFKISTINII